MDKSAAAASPDSYILPTAPSDRPDHLSALLGIRCTVNPSFEFPLFIQAARKPLLPMTDIFSDTVLTGILEKNLDTYLTSDPSSYDDSDISEVSSSTPMLVPLTVLPTQAHTPDSLGDILS